MDEKSYTFYKTKSEIFRKKNDKKKSVKKVPKAEKAEESQKVAKGKRLNKCFFFLKKKSKGQR